MRGFGFGLNKRTIIGFYNKSKSWVITAFNAFNNYMSRVDAGAGTLYSFDCTKDIFRFLNQNNLYNDTLLTFTPSGGIKYREKYEFNLLTYGYDLTSLDNDVSQPVALLQPFLTAFNNDGCTLGVNSAYGAELEHPDIVITQPSTIIKANFSIGNIGVVVTTETVDDVTLNKINWTGDLFYYRIHNGLLTEDQIAEETAWLESWIHVYDDSNYQGLEWVQKSETEYIRLGTISDIPISQSAGDANLPIQSQMKRCLLLDNGTVNYYIDPAEPINKVGAGYIKTGTTTGVSTDKLIDSSGDFITNGVVAGMTVRNVSTGNIAVIYSVTATELTLSRNYFTSGVAYQIGSANYGGADGQVMVQIPKFYMRHEYTDTKIRWAISLEQLPGFQLHPAFFKDGVEVDYRYYSAFEGSMFDASNGAMTAKGSIPLNLYATGDKFCSIAGQWPKTNERWDEYDLGSEARGVGWRNIDFALNSAVQLLYLIEYASFHTQSMIGMGRTQLSSGGWEADSYIGQTGYSIVDGNSSNSVSNGGTAGQLTDYMSYRGIENWYGNVWKDLSFIVWDGTWTGTEAAQPVYWTNDISKRSYDSQGQMTLLTNASYIGTSAGYVDNVENVYGFIPQSVGASNVVADYYYQYSESGRDYWRLVRFGGLAGYGGSAGGFTLSAIDGWTFAAVGIGGRIAY